MPTPDRSAAQQGIVLDEKGLEQHLPRSMLARKTQGNDAPGDPKQS